ncbi:subtilisin-like protease [Colletotrichum truncatum]|uniref:Subtilisin-like protease n=1 Tax=Colletotrichum truncatum TaxID=5467 RepID=A0ACC3ZLA6_COLTU|nr:subtilisin-like protease [Colletotrichum truncatum]KAF6786998.1 subtilisin-like protease [Colletotrichum truncatum]
MTLIHCLSAFLTIVSICCAQQLHETSALHSFSYRDQEAPQESISNSFISTTVQATSTGTVENTNTATNTAAPSAAAGDTAADYVIFAKAGITKEDGDAFGNTLANMVGEPNMDAIYNELDTPFIWRANLSPDQLDKVKADSVVSEVQPNESATRDTVNPGPASTQASSPSRQKRAEASGVPTADNDIFDLRTLSTPPHMATLPDYRFDDSGGKGITVFVIDTGPFVLKHDEFAPPATKATRRELRLTKNKKSTLEDTQHGTCVASKVVGKTAGSAVGANLVAIQIEPHGFGLIDGFQAALNEIKRKKLKGKAVVTTSILVRPRHVWLKTETRRLVEGFVEEDVPFITAAGNFAEQGITEPDTLPAILADELPIIVVGAATKDFKMAAASQRGRLLTTWAVGEEIKCADPSDLSGLATVSGTSFAAPQVAGIAAYWMAHPDYSKNFVPGKVSTNMRNILGILSYPRIDGPDYPSIAWNGYDIAETCKGVRGTRRKRRDLSQACSFAPKSAPASAASSATPSASAGAASQPMCGTCGDDVSRHYEVVIGGLSDCTGAEDVKSACEATEGCECKFA